MTTRYLINADFKAIRKGNQFLQCDSSVGECIIDVYDIKLTSIQICEIGGSNGIKLKYKDKKSNNLLKLIDHLNTLKIGEITQMTDTQKAKEIINQGFESGKSEDEILIELISAGIKYKAAGKLYSDIACSEGHIMSVVDRRKAVMNNLDEEEFAPGEYAEVESMIAYLTEGESAIIGLESATALRLIKAWAKLNDIELPKKLSKGPAEHLIGVGFRGAVMSWMLQQAAPTVDEIAEKIGDLQKKSSVEKNLQKAKRFYEFYTFANAVKKST